MKRSFSMVVDNSMANFTKAEKFEVSCTKCRSTDCHLTITNYNKITIRCMGCGNEEK